MTEFPSTDDVAEEEEDRRHGEKQEEEDTGPHRRQKFDLEIACLHGFKMKIQKMAQGRGENVVQNPTEREKRQAKEKGNARNQKHHKAKASE